jgi:hypothetical protein
LTGARAESNYRIKVTTTNSTSILTLNPSREELRERPQASPAKQCIRRPDRFPRRIVGQRLSMDNVDRPEALISSESRIECRTVQSFDRVDVLEVDEIIKEENIKVNWDPTDFRTEAWSTSRPLSTSYRLMSALRLEPEDPSSFLLLCYCSTHYLHALAWILDRNPLAENPYTKPV